MRAWSQAYRDDGLVVIGVHTPEFSFEHDVDGVRRATEDRAIDYPVAVDNDYAIWSAFANHYWPALYFVDADGVIRDQHFGEGRYEVSERVIQRSARRRARARLGRGDRRRGGGRLGQPADARDVSGLRAVERPRRPSAAPQRLGARRRVDDRRRERRARPGGRQHRLPLPRARRAPRAVARSARADPLPRAPRRRAAGPVTRRRRRRGRERRAPGRPHVPARAPARGRTRPHAGDHVPRARRRGVRFTFG